MDNFVEKLMYTLFTLLVLAAILLGVSSACLLLLYIWKAVLGFFM